MNDGDELFYFTGHLQLPMQMNGKGNCRLYLLRNQVSYPIDSIKLSNKPLDTATQITLIPEQINAKANVASATTP